MSHFFRLNDLHHLVNEALVLANEHRNATKNAQKKILNQAKKALRMKNDGYGIIQIYSKQTGGIGTV